MIALHDDFNQQKIGGRKSPAHIRNRMQTLLQKLQGIQLRRQQRKADGLALNQLMQLDDALLKDMGIERSELDAIKRGTLSFDALVKHHIVVERDNANFSQAPRKMPD